MLKNTLLVTALMAIGACSGSKEVVEGTVGQETVLEARLTENMDAVLWYSTSAERDLIFRQTYEWAKQKLVKNLADNPEKPAIIVDLDETVLDNSAYFIASIAKNEDYDTKTWTDWLYTSSATVLPGAAEFLKFAESKGVEIFYVSNRPAELLQVTMNNLVNLEVPIKDPSQILLMEGSEDKSDRRDMVMSNHKIVLLLGDNLRDFSEAFNDREDRFGKNILKTEIQFLDKYCVIFPNPVYGSWEKPWSAKGSTGKREFFKFIANRMDER